MHAIDGDRRGRRCEDCTKRAGPTLFGEKEAEQYIDPRCLARKLAAHIQVVKEEFKQLES